MNKKISSLASAKANNPNRIKSAIGAALMATTALVTSTAIMTIEASAQSFTTGVIDGLVMDQSGNPISGATVTLTDPSIGLKRTTTSSADGSFRFARLGIGNYIATVETEDGTFTDKVRLLAGNVLPMTIVTGTTLEEITVTASAILSTRKPFNSQEGGIVVDTDDLMVRVPIGRDITSIGLLAPGASSGDAAFGNLASFSGSSVAENTFYVNGFNFTDIRRFLGTTNDIPFEFFQQVDVKTGAFAAEFGRATGAVTNLVTRRGTNEFKGGASIDYTSESLRERNLDTTDTIRSLDERTTTELNAWLSGPIIEDRLFFYGLISSRGRNTTNFFNSTVTESNDDSPIWGINIDAVLLDSDTFGYHTFTFSHIDDERNVDQKTFRFERGDDDSDGFATGEIGTLRGETQFNLGGNTDIFKYNGVINDNITVSFLYGDSTSRSDSGSSTADNPAIRDSRSGTRVNLGNFGAVVINPVNSDRRELFRGDVDIYVPNLLGEHQFRVGFDREDVTSAETSSLTGGFLYDYFVGGNFERFGFGKNEFDGIDTVRTGVRTTGGEFTSIRSAFYAQDVWQVTSQLSLNLGVRVETFDNKAVDGSTFAKQSNLFDYRAGLTYDVFGDQSAKFFAFSGTYHLPVANNTNVRLAGQEFFTFDNHVLLGLNADDTPILGDFIGQDVVSPGGIQDPRTLVSLNLTAQKTQEFIIGYEQSFGDWTFGVRGTYRDLQNGLEDLAIDRGIRNLSDELGFDTAGLSDVWVGFHQFILANPGQDVQVFVTSSDLVVAGVDGAPDDTRLLDHFGGDPDGDGVTLVNFTAAQLNLPEISRTYKALEFTARRDFVDGWSVNASYVLSDLEGNFEGGVLSDIGQTDTGLTQNFDTAGLTVGTFGKLPNHHSHTFKLFGSYEVMDNLIVGWNATVQSPRFFGCIGQSDDDIAAQFGSAAFFCPLDENGRPSATADGRITPRGTIMQSEWTKQLDLSVSYRPDLDLGGYLQPTFRVSVFNVFNSHDITDRQEQGTFGNGAPRDTFGDPTGFLAPRSIRLSMRAEF